MSSDTKALLEVDLEDVTDVMAGALSLLKAAREFNEEADERLKAAGQMSKDLLEAITAISGGTTRPVEIVKLDFPNRKFCASCRYTIFHKGDIHDICPTCGSELSVLASHEATAEPVELDLPNKQQCRRCGNVVLYRDDLPESCPVCGRRHCWRDLVTPEPAVKSPAAQHESLDPSDPCPRCGATGRWLCSFNTIGTGYFWRCEGCKGRWEDSREVAKMQQAAAKPSPFPEMEKCNRCGQARTYTVRGPLAFFVCENCDKVGDEVSARATAEAPAPLPLETCWSCGQAAGWTRLSFGWTCKHCSAKWQSVAPKGDEKETAAQADDPSPFPEMKYCGTCKGMLTCAVGPEGTSWYCTICTGKDTEVTKAQADVDHEVRAWKKSKREFAQSSDANRPGAAWDSGWDAAIAFSKERVADKLKWALEALAELEKAAHAAHAKCVCHQGRGFDVAASLSIAQGLLGVSQSEIDQRLRACLVCKKHLPEKVAVTDLGGGTFSHVPGSPLCSRTSS